MGNPSHASSALMGWYFVMLLLLHCLLDRADFFCLSEAALWLGTALPKMPPYSSSVMDAFQCCRERYTMCVAMNCLGCTQIQPAHMTLVRGKRCELICYCNLCHLFPLHNAVTIPSH